MSDTAGHSQHLKNTCHLVRRLSAPARGGGRVQRRRRPAADQRRVPFGQSPALHGGRHARAGLPAVHPGVGGAAAPGLRASRAVTRNGSAATTRCGGSSSSRSHWAGCYGLTCDDHGPDGQDRPDDSEYGEQDHGHRAPAEEGGHHAHVQQPGHKRGPGDGGVKGDPAPRRPASGAAALRSAWPGSRRRPPPAPRRCATRGPGRSAC